MLILVLIQEQPKFVMPLGAVLDCWIRPAQQQAHRRWRGKGYILHGSKNALGPDDSAFLAAYLEKLSALRNLDLRC